MDRIYTVNIIKNVVFFILFSAFCFPTTSFADTAGKDGIWTEKCRIRYIPLKDPKAAGYMVIHNDGAEDRTVVAVTTDQAKGVMMHEMVMEGAMAKMVHLLELPIPSKGTVELKSGGIHLMFMKLNPNLKFGETIQLNLAFKNGEKVTVDAKIVSIREDREMYREE